jgi:hypothetical protein
MKDFGTIDVPDPTPKNEPSIRVHLGGLSRWTWLNYKERDTHKDVIEWAEAVCEADAVTRMQKGNSSATGDIFYLKNKHKYVDKYEQEQTGEQSLKINVSYKDYDGRGS